jgi:hypothetical protein
MFHHRTGRTLAVSVALLVLVVGGAYGLAGCGEGSDNGGVTTTGPAEGSITHPAGGNEVMLRVSTGGGFVPVEYNLTQLPEFTLYGDGTVIVTGPVIMIYPGPALPNLQTTTISEEAIQAILSAAREAGLFTNGVDYGQPQVTDLGTTTITVNADGTTYQADIYALGAESGAGGLTLEQQQARGAISDLTGKLLDLTAFETGELQWTAYEYPALAVFSRTVDPGLDPGTDGVEPNRLEWPLGDLITIGEAVQPEGYRKVVISGEDLATLQPLLNEATQITIWTVGDSEYNLYFRPLLPDEFSPSGSTEG